MNLHPEARAILGVFLKVRFWALWIIFQSIGAAVFFLPEILPFTAGMEFFVAAACTGAGMVCHLLAAPPPGTLWARVRASLDAFWLGTAGSMNVRPRHAILAGATLAILVPALYRLEGVRYTSYRDIVGVWTDCVGETQGAGPNQHYTPAQCRSKLVTRLQTTFWPEVVRAIPQAVNLPPETQAMLASIWYNEGDDTMHDSSVARAGRAGHYHQMCRNFMHFQKPPQLHDRRVFEMTHCLKGLNDAGIVQ